MPVFDKTLCLTVELNGMILSDESPFDVNIQICSLPTFISTMCVRYRIYGQEFDIKTDRTTFDIDDGQYWY